MSHVALPDSLSQHVAVSAAGAGWKAVCEYSPGCGAGWIGLAPAGFTPGGEHAVTFNAATARELVTRVDTLVSQLGFMVDQLAFVGALAGWAPEQLRVGEPGDRYATVTVCEQFGMVTVSDDRHGTTDDAWQVEISFAVWPQIRQQIRQAADQADATSSR